MGPDLEKSKASAEAFANKDIGSFPQVSEDKLVQCVSSYEDNNFHEETLNDDQPKVLTASEDMEINIIDCTKSGDNEQVEARCEDETESMSSFSDTLSETENGSALSDIEVESKLCVGDAPAAIFDKYGGAFQMRKKRLTDHWRRFIRPLMWRCKWIELQIKEFQSQALKYDRELAKHEQRKQFDFDTFVVEGFDAKSLPFSGCTQRKKVMKRKKRKRVEETADITSYVLQHNLFSYYENGKSAANGAFMTDDCGNPDKAINGNDEFGLQDGWASLESKGIDNIRENILWKIEMLQLQVHKLKARIEKVVSENPGKFCSVNRLSAPPSCDALTNQNPASPLELGERMPARSLCTLSQHMSDFKDIMPETAVSSHGEVTPLPDMIESTSQAQTEEGILIHNQAAKEEMQDLKIVGHQLTEKHHALMEKQAVRSSEADIHLETFVPRVNFGGKTLPKSRSNVSNNKKKRGRRKSHRGGWNRRSLA
ncbi:hypothetical protein P3X46_012562 [Hevea brasiliensis]|uniref:Uncharacterized protein n=1 Tax=Hevea brasiliensis TaxID=3981 RepID=A0ABQ9MAN5_HEVBR|nr:uncharacterized protein LOC110647739 [Hevea brasiliensis]KAJ9177329.1 hypothetical protein P3X46_012562 [Hevea brasiliensis]